MERLLIHKVNRRSTCEHKNDGEKRVGKKMEQRHNLTLFIAIENHLQ